MNILIACEYSGIVRDAFRAKGHNAWSCDLLPTEGDKEYHLQQDAMAAIYRPSQSGLRCAWDMVIAFPPCTHLASSGAQYWPAKKADGRQGDAIRFFMKIAGHSCPRIAIENPVGIISTVYRKPDQIIQPYQFGDPVTKKTCLWLKGLPPLAHTDIVEPVASHCTSSKYGGPRKDGTRRQNPLPVLYGDSHNRSRSFQGIADAMAEQWS